MQSIKQLTDDLSICGLYELSAKIEIPQTTHCLWVVHALKPPAHHPVEEVQGPIWTHQVEPSRRAWTWRAEAEEIRRSQCLSTKDRTKIQKESVTIPSAIQIMWQ
jgi:hypothetical protein